MRKIKIERTKKFFNNIAPIFLFIDNENNEPIKIKNGESYTCDLDNNNHKLIIKWLVKNDFSGDTYSSYTYLLDNGTDDVNLQIINHYNFFKGSSFIIVK